MPISINHAALFVKDLEGARTFYETYFDAVANELYHNPRTGLRTYFLTFDGVCRLEIMERPVDHAMELMRPWLAEKRRRDLAQARAAAAGSGQ